MKTMLEKIIKECANYGIPVDVVLAKDGSISYRVKGFSKSGEALIGIEEDYIYCRTRYDRIDHILTFHDLAFIAYEWYEDYKDRSPFEEPESYWKKAFDNLRITYITREEKLDYSDLPF